jgi:predicted enzyme related to lactoylglutathione lyase
MTETSRTLAIGIDRPMAQVYDYVIDPTRMTEWASGLASTLEQVDGKWVGETPDGRATIRFSPRNAFGIADHWVAFDGRAEIHMPIRVVAHGGQAEVLITVLRQPGMDDEMLARDADWVMRDLARLRDVLEGQPARDVATGRDGRVDYVEFHGPDLDQVEGFYGPLFGWRFTDYGPQYRAFSDGRMDGGFSPDAAAMPLVVLYADDLDATAAKVAAAGARIVKPIFAFPGGRRFHFVDPAGNELAVWSEA